MSKKKRKRERKPKPKPQTISIPDLEKRGAAMTQQLARKTHEVALLQGALQLCGDLLKQAKGITPMAGPEHKDLTQEDIARIREESRAALKKQIKAGIIPADHLVEPEPKPKARAKRKPKAPAE